MLYLNVAAQRLSRLVRILFVRRRAGENIDPVVFQLLFDVIIIILIIITIIIIITNITVIIITIISIILIIITIIIIITNIIIRLSYSKVVKCTFDY